MRRKMRSHWCRARGGWSVLELVVTVFVLLDLLALLLPWLESLGESGRAEACARNLELLGHGAIEHAAAHRFYPSGGWGYFWLGDPDRGFGEKQPGGWMYSILPFIDRKELWSLGTDVSPTSATARKRQAWASQITTVIPIFYCPTRRPAGLYPYRAKNTPMKLLKESIQHGVIKSDFAINVGDVPKNQLGAGPKSLAAGDGRGYTWPQTSDLSGVSFLRSEIKPSDVTDGLSQTYLIGEKYLNSKHYTDGWDAGDNEAAMCGYDDDVNRCAGGYYPTPLQDTPDEVTDKPWGSAHPDKLHFVFCDGSVHTVSYEIDKEVHSHLANRHDGVALPSSDREKWVDW